MTSRSQLSAEVIWRPSQSAMVVGFMLLWGVSEVHSAALAEPPYSKTNLISFLAHWKPSTAALGTICTLDPEWVGTVKRVYLRGGENIYKDDKPNDVRFSHVIIFKDFFEERTNLSIIRGRITAGEKLGSYAQGPVFMSNLPTAKAVSEAKNVEDLRKMFGPQHGFTDGWGGEKRMHWTEGWTCFTAESTNRLRYLSVFAHVSSSNRAKPADIDILRVSEGTFRRADPASAAEKIQFKTGEEVHAEYEAGRSKSRAKYPLPLRSLVEARETPDDSDLNAYKRALNEIRRNPPAELFRQFADWIHEGTCGIRGMLEDILFDGFLKLDPWEEPQRKIALRALVDALPHVKTNMDLDDLVVFLLQAHGGGELKLGIPGTNARIDVKANRSPDGRGASASLGSQNVSVENLSAVAEACRQALKERYADLR